MTRPRLLDLFCGAGGCAVGYHRAGFDVVGVDCKPQPRYPFPFICADAVHAPVNFSSFDAIHASPPCQAYSIGTHARAGHPDRKDHPDLAEPIRALLEASGRPWIIENVPGVPLEGHRITLCGLMFGPGVFRHRAFVSSELLLAPPHPSHKGKRIGVGGMVCVAGHGGQTSGFGERSRAVPADHRTKAAWEKGMGITWMTRDELAQAIPPAYTEYLGKQLIALLERNRVPTVD